MPRTREDLDQFVLGLVDAAEGADLPFGACSALSDADLRLARKGLMGRQGDDSVTHHAYTAAFDGAVLNEPADVTTGHEVPDTFACLPSTGLVAQDLAGGGQTDPLGGDGPEDAEDGVTLPSGLVVTEGVGEDPWWVGYALADDPFSLATPAHEREHHLVATQGFDRDAHAGLAFTAARSRPRPTGSTAAFTSLGDGGSPFKVIYHVGLPFDVPPVGKVFFRVSYLLSGGGETAMAEADPVAVWDPVTSPYMGAPDFTYDDGLENRTYGMTYAANDAGDVVLAYGRLSCDIAVTQASRPARAIGVAVYAAYAADRDATEPDGLYRLVEEVPFSDAWTTDGGNEEIVVNVDWFDLLTAASKVEYAVPEPYASHSNIVLDDAGNPTAVTLFTSVKDLAAILAGPTYEARTGVAETTPYGVMRYGCCCYHDGFLFVGDVDHSVPTGSEVPGLGREPSALVRALPYHGDAFNWPEDAVGLPFRPTALASYGGRVWAFGRTSAARVNPATLAAEDVVQGVGAFGPRSVAEGGGALLVAGPLGAFLVLGNRVEPVSEGLIPVTWQAFADAVEGDPGATVEVGYEPRSAAFVVTRRSADGATGASLAFRPPSEGRPPMWATWVLPGRVTALLSWQGRADSADAEAGLYSFSNQGIHRVGTLPTRKAWSATLHRRACGAPQIPTMQRRSYLRVTLRAAEGLALPTTTLQYALDAAALGNLPAADAGSVENLSAETVDAVYELPKGTRARTIRFSVAGTNAQGLGALSVVYRPVGTA